MTLPAGLTTITVTGSFLSAAGVASAGSVAFTPTAAVADPAGQVILTAVPVTAVLVSGAFSLLLPCTDNAGLTPAGWAYSVSVAVPGSQQAFTCYLPHALGAAVDFSSLAPVSGSPSPSGVSYLPNATAVPASGPSLGGGFLYATGGALYWLSTGGLLTRIAPN